MDGYNLSMGLEKLFKSHILWVGLLALIYISFVHYSVDFERHHLGFLGLALDDSWIHMTLAKNLASGNGFSINPHEWLPASTAPAWTLLLAGVFLFVSNPIAASLGLSVVVTMLAILAVYWLAFLLIRSRWFAALAAILLTIEPLALWGMLSGMEIPLVLLVVALVFISFYCTKPFTLRRRILIPVVLALSVFTRPELMALSAVVLFASFYQHCGIKGRSNALRESFFEGGIFLALLLPYFSFNLITIHHIFPTTFYAKVQVRGVGAVGILSFLDTHLLWRKLVENPLFQCRSLVMYFLKDNLALGLLIPLGLVAFAKSFQSDKVKLDRLLPLALVTLAVAVGIVAPTRAFSNVENRYAAIFLPLFSVFAAVGLWFLYEKARLRILTCIAVVLVLVPLPRVASRVSRELWLDVRTTDRLYVDAGKWLANHTEENDVIAVNDIGAISFFAHRHLLDLMGLASPEIWPVIKRERGKLSVAKLREFLKTKKVSYLVVSPHYYPSLTRDIQTFELVTSFSSSNTRGRMISPQNVYRCHWT